tara:strand:+ start:158 stop:703 length:546 start_codon:yes stop_codon:yes gene_type:complete
MTHHHAMTCRMNGAIFPSQAEAARRLGYHVNTIRKAIESGREWVGVSQPGAIRNLSDLSRDELEIRCMELEAALGLVRNALPWSPRIPLSPSRRAILGALFRSRGRPVPTSALAAVAPSNNHHEPATDATVKVLICTMRRSLKEAGFPDAIQTVWGVGYVIDAASFDALYAEFYGTEGDEA